MKAQVSVDPVQALIAAGGVAARESVHVFVCFQFLQSRFAGVGDGGSISVHVLHIHIDCFNSDIKYCHVDG